MSIRLSCDIASLQTCLVDAVKTKRSISHKVKGGTRSSWGTKSTSSQDDSKVCIWWAIKKNQNPQGKVSSPSFTRALRSLLTQEPIKRALISANELIPAVEIVITLGSSTTLNWILILFVPAAFLSELFGRKRKPCLGSLPKTPLAFMKASLKPLQPPIIDRVGFEMNLYYHR